MTMTADLKQIAQDCVTNLAANGCIHEPKANTTLLVVSLSIRLPGED